MIYVTIYTKEFGKQELTIVEWYAVHEPELTFHRLDGPAKEFANGNSIWYIDGLRHRIDGPAIVFRDGDEAWFVRGQRLDKLSKNYLARYMRLKNLTIAHLLLDPSDMIRNSANKIKWE